MKPAVNISRIAGFTLIELMVTLAIVAILATVAAPMLQTFLARSQMNAVANDLTGALQLARMEAVARNSCVSVCRRVATGAAQCAGDDGPWTTGWLVYENAACDGAVTAADPPSGTTLKARDAVPASIMLNTQNGAAPAVVSFSPRGALISAPGSNMIMQISDSRFSDGSLDRSVKLARTGRIVTVAGLEGGNGD